MIDATGSSHTRSATRARSRLLPALAAVAILSLPGAAAEARSGPESVGRALRNDPVYADRRADPGISVREAGRLRLRILRRDLGRIKIAVVPQSEADRVGGIAPLSNAIDNALGGIRGTLIVSAGSGLHLVTSYPESERAVAAVRSAVAAREGRRLAPKLLEAVDRLAKVDPGPERDISAPVAPPITIPAIPFTDARGTADDVVGTFKVVVYTILALIVFTFLLVGFLVWRRVRRQRAEQYETFEDDRAAARDELIALGDEIRALDLDVSMPSADSAGKGEYERALGCYERADRGLAQADTPRRLKRAQAELTEGRRAMEAAKARFAGQAGAADRPA